MEQNCRTCVHENIPGEDEPCWSCGYIINPSGTSNWQQKHGGVISCPNSVRCDYVKERDQRITNLEARVGGLEAHLLKVIGERDTALEQNIHLTRHEAEMRNERDIAYVSGPRWDKEEIEQLTKTSISLQKATCAQRKRIEQLESQLEKSVGVPPLIGAEGYWLRYAAQLCQESLDATDGAHSLNKAAVGFILELANRIDAASK